MIDTRAEEHHQPEKVWADKAAEEHYKFRLQLEKPALRDLLDDAERLKQLRYNIEQLDSYKKTFRHALFEMKVDLDKAVLKASEPNWDSEDEQKHGGDDMQALRAKRLARFDSSENK
jgi:hypothetical protein